MDLPEYTTHSFIVRIWLEEKADNSNKAKWRGHITHIPSNFRRYLENLDDIRRFIAPYLEGMEVRPGNNFQGGSVSSMFSFLRSREDTPVEVNEATTGLATVPNELAAITLNDAPEDELVLPPNNASSPEEALALLLEALGLFLPEHDETDPLPEGNVSITSVSELSLAIGNLRGFESRGSKPIVALKGGRLDVGVRYQLWGDSPGDLDSAIDSLHADLLAAKDNLWEVGFLRLDDVGSGSAEHVPSVSGWRKTADYQILYEFHYDDSEGAESLIARIPIHSNPEVLDSLFRETTTVTDEMIRWDNVAAPTLEVHKGSSQVAQVQALEIVAFLPDSWDGDAVIVSALIDGTTSQRSFPTLRAFLDTFTLDPGTISLGANQYVTGRWLFPNSDFPGAILLQGGVRNFRIQYAEPMFDSDAIVYIRVL